MPVRVHQYHSGCAPGDAVTNSMLLLQRHLRDMGLDSDVFADQPHPDLTDRIRPRSELRGSLEPHDVLLVHHSLGHDAMDWLLHLGCRKVLQYHNITPPNFFPDGSPLQSYARLGYEQLGLLMGQVEAAYTDSKFNQRDLLKRGYRGVKVLPVLVDIESFANTLSPRCLETGTGRPWTVLFVGRVAENKGHRELVQVAAWWAKTYPQHPVQFICVGSYAPDDPLFKRLEKDVRSHGLAASFRFVGKVSDSDLIDWYARSDCYLSLSEHEGFGVPLTEAMLSDLPVVALGTSAVFENVDTAGVLLATPEPAAVGAVLYRLMRNRPFRRAVVARQREHVRQFRDSEVRARVSEMLSDLGVEHVARPIKEPEPESAGIRIEGPCDTSYSLAIVNRELAIALNDSGEPTALFCTEGPGDYTPAAADLAALTPQVQEMIAAGRGSAVPTATIRNLYPPRVRDARGDIVAEYFFWEESVLPREYVRDFNVSLDVVLAPSRFVADTLRSSGVNVPIQVVGAGADHIMRVALEPLPFGLPDGFKFLHISSCFPRKGPDVLLRSFGRAFAGRTDVALVIKTFPNPHNLVEELLDQLRSVQPDFPPVVVINEDYSPGQLRSLYEACDAYVAPSRGEGFGLPMAEAMLHRMPVIATGWGGHTGFCTESTSYPVRFTLEPSESHVAGDGLSLWAEPDEDHLVERLLQVEGQRGETERLSAAEELIRTEFTWAGVAKRARAAVDSSSVPTRDFAVEPLRLAWVSTWNEPCGIAGYSKFLLDHLDPAEVDLRMHGRIGTSQGTDTVPISTLWKDHADGSLDALYDQIIADGSEVAVFQFNFGFFGVRALARVVAALEDAGVRVIVTFHRTRELDRPDFQANLRDGVDGLSRASRLLVHSLEDLHRLAGLGLGDRAALFPQGVMDVPSPGMQGARKRLELSPAAKIIASYGFMLPHKGLAELVDAFAVLCSGRKDVYLFMVNALYPDGVSNEVHQQLLARMEELGIRDRVRVFTDFLPDQVSLSILQAADVVVFPYQETAESSSAAVRFGLAARRPVATTNLGIFDDLESNGLRFSGFDAKSISKDLAGWLDDPATESVVAGQDSWLQSRSWPLLMLRLTDMARGLVLDGERETDAT